MTINLDNNDDITITFKGATVTVRAHQPWVGSSRGTADWISVHWSRDLKAKRKGEMLIVEAPGKADRV